MLLTACALCGKSLTVHMSYPVIDMPVCHHVIDEPDDGNLTETAQLLYVLLSNRKLKQQSNTKTTFLTFMF